MKSTSVTGLITLTSPEHILSQTSLNTLDMSLRNQLMAELVTGKKITKRDRTSNVLKRLGKNKAIVYYLEKIKAYREIEEELSSLIFKLTAGANVRWPAKSLRAYATPYEKKLNRVQMKRNRAEVFLLKLIQGNVADRDLPNYK